MPTHRHLKRFALLSASAAALLSSSLIPGSSADLSTQLNSAQSSASALQSQISAETAKIGQTRNGVAKAQAELAIQQARLNTQVANLHQVQTQLLNARDQLESLEKRLTLATDDLADNLRADYENGQPDLVDVILNSSGFSNLLDQVSFLKTVSKENAQIVGFTRAARTRVLKEAIRLGKLEERDRALTDQIMAQRNQVAAIKSALLQQQISEVQDRANTRAKLDKVSSRLQSLQSELNTEEAQAEAEAQQTGEQVNESGGGLPVDTDGMVSPIAGAPAAVNEMIAAGNAIATLPYIWGGGHASFISPGYDCSGSVSYVLAAAGLLSSPETSDEFESYGDPGPGKWVTIYATDGHVWMTIAGWRFDTVALAEYGTRWSRGGGEFGGYVERHPPGL